MTAIYGCFKCKLRRKKKKKTDVCFGPNKWNFMDERGKEKRYRALRSGGLHPAMDGQSLPVLTTFFFNHYTSARTKIQKLPETLMMVIVIATAIQ